MGSIDQPVEVLLGPEDRVDPLVVADVVAEIEPGRSVDRRQPDRVHAEAVRTEVVQVVDDPDQVADTVAVRVGEGSRVDLVDHPTLPPIVPEPGPLYDRCKAGGPQADDSRMWDWATMVVARNVAGRA